MNVILCFSLLSIEEEQLIGQVRCTHNNVPYKCTAVMHINAHKQMRNPVLIHILKCTYIYPQAIIGMAP